MEELLGEQSFENLKEGSIVEGTIIEIRQNEVVLDIGTKSEGSIAGHEFVDLGDLEIGQSVEVFLEKIEDKEGNPVISFDKAEQKKNWESLKILYRANRDSFLQHSNGQGCHR